MGNVSLEELLRTLEEAEEALSPTKIEEVPRKGLTPHLDGFIEDFSITTSTERVPNYIIFYAYRVLWEGITQCNKNSKIRFFRSMSDKFISARDGKMRYYLISKDSFDMTREGKLKAKHYDERYKKRIKEKSSKKSKSTKKVQSKK